MIKKVMLAGGLSVLFGSAQVQGWDTKCEYGSFDQDNMYCEVSNGFGENSAFNVWYRAGNDSYGFSYRVPRIVQFVKESPIEARLDDSDAVALGEVRHAGSLQGGSRTGPSSYFTFFMPVEDAESFLARLENANVLRLLAEAEGSGDEGYLYAEVPLVGFDDAIRALRSNTK